MFTITAHMTPHMHVQRTVLGKPGLTLIALRKSGIRMLWMFNVDLVNDRVMAAWTAVLLKVQSHLIAKLVLSDKALVHTFTWYSLSTKDQKKMCEVWQSNTWSKVRGFQESQLFFAIR